MGLYVSYPRRVLTIFPNSFWWQARKLPMRQGTDMLHEHEFATTIVLFGQLLLVILP